MGPSPGLGGMVGVQLGQLPQAPPTQFNAAPVQQAGPQAPIPHPGPAAAPPAAAAPTHGHGGLSAGSQWVIGLPMRLPTGTPDFSTNTGIGMATDPSGLPHGQTPLGMDISIRPRKWLRLGRSHHSSSQRQLRTIHYSDLVGEDRKMGSAPSPPPAPDPVATANAQTGENVDTAIANAQLSHVDQTDAGGDTSTYNQIGSSTFTDPVSGKTYQIPNYSQSTTLSQPNQQIYNTNQATQQNLATIGQQQSAAIGNTLNTPINEQGVNLSSVGNLPNADLTANNINSFINTNWEQPLAYSQGNQQEQLNQNLADMGINLNDPAYNQAQINQGQNFQQQQDTYANSMYGTAASNILGATSLADQNQLNTVQANNNAALSQQGFNNQASSD